ncbi:Xaa-Pro peptidase family protein [Candidatus Woesearchaeota archaeon]|nr:Xaa-Pro peptidase family protein [Candidatus Woesearchaeota archaeon]
MRLNQFKAELAKKGVDFAVFLNLDTTRLDSNLFYFSGFEGIGALIIPKNKRPFLVAPLLDYERAKKCGMKVYAPKKKKRLLEYIATIVKKNRIRLKKIGIDKGSLTLREHKALKKYFRKSKTVDVSGICFELREFKKEGELKNIKKACAISDNILKKCFGQFKRFKTESEVAAFLEFETKKLGCELAFKPIVASGHAGSMSHYVPENIKLRKGFCVIDFGVKYKGYCSDTTRTIFIGKPAKRDIEIYEFLLKIQMDAIKRVKTDMVGGDAFKFVNDSLGRYSKNFIHGLGHGLGVDIHELPNLREDSKDKLKNGMVFTIEPGIYFEKRFGIRIEDTVYLENKALVLTKIPKKMVIIN